MAKFIFKRIGLMLVTLWVIATVTFTMINLVGGDPIATKAKQLPEATQKAIRAKYKLDQPAYVRYFDYLGKLVRFDMGESIYYPGVQVNDMIAKELPASARLGLQAVVFGLIVGLSLGIIAAFKRNTWVDYLVIFIAIIGVSIPGFVVAILIQYALGGKHGIPSIGWSTKNLFWAPFKYTILPTLALSLGGIASNARFMKTSVLDVVNQDYILTAKAKGVTKASLVIKHILRNAMIPVITIVGPRIAAIITGSIIVESIFAIPGLGRELVRAIGNSDYTVIMSLTVFFAALYIISLIVVDIVYALVDPRIKVAGNKK
ncbi:ABC transporter permease [Clostridium thermarum]|uniref:ABC transporter permease n=1 Tax=Clostridium thermarum TaxID=1716543 RepID=UPI00112377FD|nr:ABC transporter permease [Clostridium thermarum]